MFNFGRKKEDKDKKRREKKDRHKKFLDGGSVMTQDELNRLSELSRKQSAGSPEKLPSGITADYRLLDKDNPDSSSLKMPKKDSFMLMKYKCYEILKLIHATKSLATHFQCI